MPELDEDALDLLDVSEKHRTLLAQLIRKICDDLGREVEHVSIYGSAARDEWLEGTSDINLLTTLETATFDKLSAIGESMARARRKANVVPMILSRKELERAADVYCVKFDSMRQHHVTMAGDDVLGALDIDDSNIRFVCEFQLRNVAMRMRQFYLQSFGQQDIERTFLLNFFNAGLFPLRGLARLTGHDVPEKVYRDFDAIGEAIDTDPGVLDEIAEIRRERTELDDEELERLYNDLNQLVQRAVTHVDQLET